MNISVVGLGYVGLANALLLARQHSICALDIDEQKIEKLRQGVSPLEEGLIAQYVEEYKEKIAFATNLDALKVSDFVFVCTPTNYNEDSKQFDTRSVTAVVKSALRANTYSTIVIKSTVPVGFTAQLCQEFNTDRIVFSPEFLREGSALTDSLYPSRIIVGGECVRSKSVRDLLVGSCRAQSFECMVMKSSEAEAVKLFSNTYLAMRVAFFNELDTYCNINKLNPLSVINGVCADKRVGRTYNNPSFGYGGYCLPKDTKQLEASFEGVPQNLISAIVHSNTTRKHHIAKDILLRGPKTVGIYRLAMKTNSDNFRYSSILDIIDLLEKQGVRVALYEPTLSKSQDSRVIENFEEFSNGVDLIVANRLNSELLKYRYKVYTRDLFSRD